MFRGIPYVKKINYNCSNKVEKHVKLNDSLNSCETFNRCSYESVNMLDLALTSEINQEKIRRKLGNFREGNARKSDLRASARLFSWEWVEISGVPTSTSTSRFLPLYNAAK